MITSGLRQWRHTWRRSRWNSWAGVVGLAIWMLSSAARLRKRSRRALECSGPMPSMPWGSIITRPDSMPHLLSPLVMNWSMMGWATLQKSPNWASHMTRASG